MENFILQEITRPITTKYEIMYYFVVSDKKKISFFLERLGKVLKLAEWSHLKRVHRTPLGTIEILLGFTSHVQKIKEFSQEHSLEVLSRNIPSRAPVDLNEALKWKKMYWSYKTVFDLPSKFNEDLIKKYLNIMAKEDLDVLLLCPVEEKTLKWKFKDTTANTNKLNPFYEDHQVLKFLLDENANKQLRNFNSYLLTDVYLFIKNEPCLMCLMGLVHYRVSMVFYMKKIESKKLIRNDNFMIHQNKKLNHKFRLFYCPYVQKMQNKIDK